MTRDELLRILSFADRMREIGETRTALSRTDARWNIVSYAMRRHLEGRLITVTSLASAAGVPYGTAMRRISELVDEGFLLRRPRSRTGKSFSLHPTRALIIEVESFAMQLKAMVGQTFGVAEGDGEAGTFYFGGSYMAPRILSYPNAMRVGIGREHTIRILSPVDPTFKTLSDFSSSLDQFCGTNVEVVTLPLGDLHREILEDHASGIGRYDLIAIDLPWVGELAEAGIIRALDDRIAQERYNAGDFHSTAWNASRWKGRQYALPIQPTPELLFVRKDLFAEAGLGIPRTTEEVLFAARVLHRSAPGLSGIVMNFGPGLPVAHTFAQTMADFGQPVIDLAPLDADFDVEDITGERLRPRIDSEVGRTTAEFLLELGAYAHPESPRCSWDRRITLFAAGEAAMTYGWSIRAARFELDRTTAAHGRVDFAPHPPAPGRRAVSPIGGFSLAIPAGLGPEREGRAWRMLEYLARPEMMKWYVLNGNLTSPRFSTSADPEVRATSRIIEAVDAMERRGELQVWPRPPVPEFSAIMDILGVEIHRMLTRKATVAEALGAAQSRVDALMRANGRY